MKPNFTQGNVIRTLERENQILRAQAQSMAQTTRLIEAAVTGLASKLNDPKDIADKAIQIAGAVIMGLEQLGQSDKETENGGTTETGIR